MTAGRSAACRNDDVDPSAQSREPSNMTSYRDPSFSRIGLKRHMTMFKARVFLPRRGQGVAQRAKASHVACSYDRFEKPSELLGGLFRKSCCVSSLPNAPSIVMLSCVFAHS